jgi:uncharacterized membrane protein
MTIRTSLPVATISTTIENPVERTTARITAIDALRGMALALIALTHAAFFIGVGMQAESYGGQRMYLQSPPYWISGLLTTLASPIFFCLAGVSLAPLEQLIWLALRLIGGYGDLGSYRAGEPIQYVLVMSKAPPSLSSKDLEYRAKRAAREWSLRPGPIIILKAASNPETLGHLWKIGMNHIRWMSGSLTGSDA